ncbi:hypothetical protein [Dactylosporangium sp. NPDC049140]|uniref:hypothetical protein n=1 Tax=Dactylosporangium sp. NPDC049140 TaxID=3155647 RepID=UPI0033F6930F
MAQHRSRAARLFRLLSVALTPGITAEAATSLSAWEPRRTREALMELAEAALVAEDDHGRFTSHVLVKAYAEELFRETEPPVERAAAVSRLLQHYLHSALNAQSELKGYFRISPPPPPPDGVVAERQGSLDNAYGWFDRHRDVLFEAVHVAAEGDHGVALGGWPWPCRSTWRRRAPSATGRTSSAWRCGPPASKVTGSARRTCAAASPVPAGTPARTTTPSTCCGPRCGTTPSTA